MTTTMYIRGGILFVNTLPLDDGVNLDEDDGGGGIVVGQPVNVI